MRSKNIKTPALVIALGTTSSKAALELCEQLLGLEQDDRDAVAIVTIDTDTSRPEFRALLETNPGKFHAFHAAIRVPPNVDQADFLDPKVRRQIFMPHYTPRYYDYGAGGIRNHGHVALAYCLDRVYGAIQDALASIKVLPPGQGHHVTDSVQVYVVAFLGGGTGSGIVVDIGVLLRDMLQTEMEGQRLLLFGILPADRIPGSGTNEESWRKSNAAAAILETLALELAGGGSPTNNKFYRKRLLDRDFMVPEGPLFNEIYLTGRTNLNDVDRVAHLVGLDLFQRITDASGIGDRERSQSPDFKDLKRTDDRELFTNFSTSCPVEVRFPLRETCEAFAYLAAGRLLQLPDFVGGIPAEPVPSQDDLGEWEEKWDQYARPAVGIVDTDPQTTLVSPLLQFEPSQFIGASAVKRRILWDQAQDYLNRIPTRLDRVRQRIYDQELDRFNDIPEAENTSGSYLESYSTRRLTHLSRLEQEFAYALKLFDEYEPDAPTSERDLVLEGKLDQLLPFNLERILPLGPITESRERKAAQAVSDHYNRVIEDVFFYQRHRMMVSLLERLRQHAEDMYESGKRDILDAQATGEGERYIQRGLQSMVWIGKLGKEHPHQIGLFDLARFHETQESRDLPMMPAMQGLYRWALTGASRETGEIGNCHRPLDITTLDDDLRSEAWMGACIRYLNKARRQDAVNLQGVNLTEAERRDALAVDAARVPGRVLDYFRERFRAIFEQLNLFDLLALGYAAETNQSRGQGYREAPNLLRTHLEHTGQVLREMVRSDPSLWTQGAETVRPTLYLGVNWRDNTPEKGWVESIARTVSFQGLDSPKVDREADPHRLQLNFSLHAISIRTMPMFFRRYNSLTTEYLRYEGLWLNGWEHPQAGNGNAATNGNARYGAGGIPVHSSEEMERLTLDPSALPNPWNLSLVYRLLRDTTPPHQEPNWGLSDWDEERTYSREWVPTSPVNNGYGTGQPAYGPGPGGNAGSLRDRFGGNSGNGHNQR